MKVKLLLVRPGGTFRRQNGQLTNDFPDHLINRRDKHGYPLLEGPIIPQTKPYPLQTFQQLVEAPPIPPNLAPEQYLAIGEDGGVWLYSPKLVQDVPGLMSRQRKREDWQEEGRQHAENESIQEGLGNRLQSFFFVACCLVFCVCAILTALVIAQYKWGGKGAEAAPQATALLGLLALGSVATPALRRTGHVAGANHEGEVVLAKPRKTGRQPISVYLYDSVDYSNKHYSLPIGEIIENLGLDSIYFPNIRTYRILAATLLSTVPALAVFALLWETYGAAGITLTVLAELPILLFSSIAGWWLGPEVIQRLSPTLRPFCLVRRGVTGVVPRLDEEIEPYPDDEAAEAAKSDALDTESQSALMTVVRPLRHTHLTGIDPEIYEDLVAELLEMARQQAIDLELDDLPEYKPIVNRARDVYEDLMARLEREDTRITSTLTEAIKTGSILVAAFAAVGILFFVAIATTT